MDIIKIVNQIPVGFQSTGGLKLVDQGDTLSDWEAKRNVIKEKWLDFLGKPPFERFIPKVQEGSLEEHDNFIGKLVYIQTEPNYYEKTYLLIPKNLREKNPGMLVLYYDIDTMIGQNRGGDHFMDTPNRFFALELVKRGYVVQVMRWFYQGYKDSQYGDAGLTDKQKTAYQSFDGENYLKGVARINKIYPGLKGLAKVTNDASYTLDYLSALPYVDSDLIGVMGHSLGGKMSLYVSAFDKRIKASVISELGIGISFCNWDAPWYLGDEVKEPGFNLDHHQLLGLIAPRPVLLLAGDDSDNNHSWHFINAAKEVYNLYGKEEAIGLYNHHCGHEPQKQAMSLAYDWLDYYLKA